MKKFVAPLVAVAATSVSLGATAQVIAGSASGFGQLLQSNPAPSVAYLMAAGFLGLIVLRRTRSGPMN